MMLVVLSRWDISVPLWAQWMWWVDPRGGGGSQSAVPATPYQTVDLSWIPFIFYPLKYAINANLDRL